MCYNIIILICCCCCSFIEEHLKCRKVKINQKKNWFFFATFIALSEECLDHVFFSLRILWTSYRQIYVYIWWAKTVSFICHGYDYWADGNLYFLCKSTHTTNNNNENKNIVWRWCAIMSLVLPPLSVPSTTRTVMCGGIWMRKKFAVHVHIDNDHCCHVAISLSSRQFQHNNNNETWCK